MALEHDNNRYKMCTSGRFQHHMGGSRAKWTPQDRCTDGNRPHWRAVALEIPSITKNCTGHWLRHKWIPHGLKFVQVHNSWRVVFHSGFYQALLPDLASLASARTWRSYCQGEKTNAPSRFWERTLCEQSSPLAGQLPTGTSPHTQHGPGGEHPTKVLATALAAVLAAFGTRINCRRSNRETADSGA